MRSHTSIYPIGSYLVCEIQADSLDIFNFGEISSECTSAFDRFGNTPVVVDLSRVELIDSMGVGLLARMKKHLGERGISMSISGPGENVLKVFELLNFRDQFSIFPTVREAVVS